MQLSQRKEPQGIANRASKEPAANLAVFEVIWYSNS